MQVVYWEAESQQRSVNELYYAGDGSSPEEILVNCVESAPDCFHRRMETWE